MVRVTAVLARIPMIKFRKGGAGRPSAAPTAATAGPASGAAQKNSPIIPEATQTPRALAVIKIPGGVLVETGKKQQQIMSLNIVLQKSEKGK